MGMASSKMYVPGNEKEAKEYFSKKNDDRKDTNIICIGFSILKQDPKNLIQNGDPILCGNCKVGFNCYSESVQKNSENNRIWNCEFCGCLNKLLIDENEIPKKEDCLYMIEAPLQKQGDLNDNLNIILCIDFSGSMSVTKEIKGKLDFKHSSMENIDDFKAFMEPWEFLQMKQNLENEAKNKTFVTRKQCVLAAIESQLNEMCTDTPNRKVGIVGFNNEVIVIGDGSKDPKVITGDKLQNYEILLQEGLDSTVTHLNTSISHSATKLFEALDKLKETGQTALGPALLVALGMASKGSHGSKLIVCTDGLANVGLGSLDNEINNNQFYDRIKEYANQSGVSINVITMKGEDCKLDVLGSLADNTNGKILRVDPENLNQDFANVIKGEILATKVELKVFLHKALEFRNEGEGEFMNNGTIYKKIVGNVTEKSEVSFEYDLKNPEKLKEFGLDMKNLKKLPFQAQVTYSTHQGKFLRIMSKFQEVSNKIEEVQREASIPVIANRAIKKSVKETLSNKNYSKAAFDSSEYFKLSEKIAHTHNDQKSFEQVNEFRRKTDNIHQSIESLERIETQKLISSPLKPPKQVKSGLNDIIEEEEKLEYTASFAGKKKVEEKKPVAKSEKMEEDADCLALQLFQMKNEEQFEYEQKDKK